MKDNNPLSELAKMRMMNLVNKKLLEFFHESVNSQEIQRNPAAAQGVADAVNDLLVVNSLLAAMTDYGCPVELVFISKDGHKIDLIKEKTLNENDLANILIDNLKSTSHED